MTRESEGLAVERRLVVVFDICSSTTILEELKRRGVLWSPSHFAASCGGAPIEILKKYIEQQQVPH